jgi:hypothetical protein
MNLNHEETQDGGQAEGRDAETRHVSLSVDRSVPGVLTYQEQQHHLHICTHRILEGRSCVHGVVGDHGMTMPPTYYCTTVPLYHNQTKINGSEEKIANHSVTCLSRGSTGLECEM